MNDFIPSFRSEGNKFTVVHNGIITNHKNLQKYLEKCGYAFESDTDTEAVAKLVAHMHKEKPDASFR